LISLESHIKDSKLLKSLDSVKQYVNENLLRFWEIHASEFVDHGIDHCSNIEALLLRIIPLEVLNQMSEHEIFLLSCGVWLHDVGMMSKETGESDKNVRAIHHVKSRKLIRTSLPEIPLNDHERYIVGELAFYHRKIENIDDAVETYDLQADSTISKIRVRFLCALLRIADGCEVTSVRSSRKLVQVNKLDHEALFHHEAHLHVSAIDFDQKSHDIIISIRVKSSDDATLLDNFLRVDIEKELISVKEVLEANGVLYSKVKTKITIDDFSEAMPKPIVKRELKLEEKLVEIEKVTGYRPSMTIESASKVNIYYNTISQTQKELQNEIILISCVVAELFSEKEMVCITLKKVHDYRETVAPIEPEIATVVVNIDEYQKIKETNDKSELWNKLHFYRRSYPDKYLNGKRLLNIRFIP
jgi:hypothetical protein